MKKGGAIHLNDGGFKKGLGEQESLLRGYLGVRRCSASLRHRTGVTVYKDS